MFKKFLSFNNQIMGGNNFNMKDPSPTGRIYEMIIILSSIIFKNSRDVYLVSCLRKSFRLN